MRATFVRWTVQLLDRLALSQLKHPATTPDHLLKGRKGEEHAYFHLRRLGYVVVARNWRSPRRKGEIDLIGWDGEFLCFIEVKTRSSRDVKPAEAAVDHGKRRELCGMAREYLRAMMRRKDYAAGGHGAAGRSGLPPCRFDVVSVYYGKGGTKATDIILFRNAFPLS
jgi:putative endonuclease